MDMFSIQLFICAFWVNKFCTQTIDWLPVRNQALWTYHTKHVLLWKKIVSWYRDTKQSCSTNCRIHFTDWGGISVYVTNTSRASFFTHTGADEGAVTMQTAVSRSSQLAHYMGSQFLALLLTWINMKHDFESKLVTATVWSFLNWRVCLHCEMIKKSVCVAEQMQQTLWVSYAWRGRWESVHMREWDYLCSWIKESLPIPAYFVMIKV